jgi:hypothetical protein
MTWNLLQVDIPRKAAGRSTVPLLAVIRRALGVGSYLLELRT